MNIENVAYMCHEANRAFCLGLGDTSQPAWHDAPEWQRNSAIEGVKFNLANPNAPASASHDSWLAVKTAEGWRYGPVKDPVAKTHPCYVEYDELPKEQQAKDHIFKALVAALAKYVGDTAFAPFDTNNAANVTRTPVVRYVDVGNLSHEKAIEVIETVTPLKAKKEPLVSTSGELSTVTPE